MENELVVSVYKFMGNDMLSGRTSEDGSPSAESFRKHILENWNRYERISITLDSIVQMTRPFLDEAFAKLLEDHSLDEFNQKIHFPDAKENTVKDLNNAFKIRLKIIQSKKSKDEDAFGL
ncbi:MAG: STAS-like domain-containing protein [Nitrospinota bacterium]|nr:STAS-like domain-containing protein [Nitrospinota bacterium]